MPFLPLGRKRGGRSQPSMPVMCIADENTLRRWARRVLKIAPDAFCPSVPCCPRNDNNQPLKDRQCDGEAWGNQNNRRSVTQKPGSAKAAISLSSCFMPAKRMRLVFRASDKARAPRGRDAGRSVHRADLQPFIGREQLLHFPNFHLKHVFQRKRKMPGRFSH